MIRVTRKYRFSASHRLHAPRLSDERKPRSSTASATIRTGTGTTTRSRSACAARWKRVRAARSIRAALDRLVKEQVLDAVRSAKPECRESRRSEELVPTTENLAREIYRRLRGELAVGVSRRRGRCWRKFASPRRRATSLKCRIPMAKHKRVVKMPARAGERDVIRSR